MAGWPRRHPVRFGQGVRCEGERGVPGFHLGILAAVMDEAASQAEGVFVERDSGGHVWDVQDDVAELHGTGPLRECAITLPGIGRVWKVACSP